MNDNIETVNMPEGEELKKTGLLKETWRSLRKNRLAMIGMGIVVVIALLCIFANVIAPYGLDDQVLRDRCQAPSAKHLFGTDHLGRDIFSRVLYGGRVSVAIGISCALLSAFFGIFFGSIAGYFGGVADDIIMRIVDIMMSLPGMLLSIAIVTALGNKTAFIIFAVGISYAPSASRIVRAVFLSAKEQEYVEAAKCIGASNFRIIMRHVLPNCLAPLIVFTTMCVANAILAASSLSFIGIGVQPPSPEWGAMLSVARPYIREYPYMVIFPGLAIMATIFGLNLFGDGLRDALDPRMKR